MLKRLLLAWLLVMWPLFQWIPETRILANPQYVFSGFNKGATGGFTFTYVTGTANTSATGTVAITLGSTPATGSLVIVSATSTNSAATFTSVKDSNNNTYTVSPNSPSNAGDAFADQVWLCYLIAPSNATATITASFGGTLGTQKILGDLWTVSGGTVSFDSNDIVGHGGPATTINNPTVVPGHTELLYGSACSSGSATITAGGTWTLGASGAATGSCATEYILSTGSNTALNMAVSNSFWDSIGAGFYAH